MQLNCAPPHTRRSINKIYSCLTDGSHPAINVSQLHLRRRSSLTDRGEGVVREKNHALPDGRATAPAEGISFSERCECCYVVQNALSCCTFGAFAVEPGCVHRFYTAPVEACEKLLMLIFSAGLSIEKRISAPTKLHRRRKLSRRPSPSPSRVVAPRCR